MDNKEYMTITSEGKEHKCEILFTYHSEEFNHSYVIFRVEDSNELSAMIYTEADDNSGNLLPVEDDAEWEMLEEVVSKYLDENQSSCSSCHGDCSCCGSDDEECECCCHE